MTRKKVLRRTNTATLVTCGWALGRLGGSSELKTLKNAKKSEKGTDQPTDGHGGYLGILYVKHFSLKIVLQTL